MMDYCRKNFAYVLVDTPPLGSVADALNIAQYCDGSILVVRSGDTSRKIVDNSVQMLKRTESPLLGLVLNRVDVESRSNPYYRRYYGSDYSYKNGYRYGGYGYGRSRSHDKKTNNGGK